MNESFQYSPLPPVGWIRLLVIEPASRPAKPLRMRLETCEITNELDYEALSYTWGNGFDCWPIRIHGKQMMIRRNLLMALTALRRSDVPLPIWVDAICINQNDITERNHQVWQIKDIYSKARLVNVWLGDTDVDAVVGLDLGMDFIREFGDALIKRHPTASDRIKVGSTWRADSKGVGLVVSSTLSEKEFFEYYGYLSLNLGSGGDQNARVQNAIQLLRNTWWKRIWTLQESVLGRHVMVYCGSKRVPMQNFFEFSYFLFLAMAYERRFSFETLPKDIALRAVFRIADLRDHINGRGHVPTLLAIDSSWNRAALDDKDKIMALLGLMSWHSDLRPEYGWDIGRVYRMAIDNVIIEENNLGFLGLISEEDTLRSADLPSWVPDLRLHTQYHSDYLTSLSKAIWHGSVYNASLMIGNDKRAEIRTEEAGSLLVVRGILLDRVLTLGWKAPGHKVAMSVLGGALSHEEAWRAAMLDQWARLLITTLGGRKEDVQTSERHASSHPVLINSNTPGGRSSDQRGPRLQESFGARALVVTNDSRLRVLCEMGKYAPTGEDYLTAFWRCVFVDLKQGTHDGYDPGKPQRLDQEDISLFSEQYSEASENTMEPLFVWWSSFSGHRTSSLRLIEQFNRIFFITQDGYIGLGPPWLQEIDAVCILSGGSVAYALRELDGDKWLYIGEW